jgi:hypothetical protein
LEYRHVYGLLQCTAFTYKTIIAANTFALNYTSVLQNEYFSCKNKTICLCFRSKPLAKNLVSCISTFTLGDATENDALIGRGCMDVMVQFKLTISDLSRRHWGKQRKIKSGCTGLQHTWKSKPLLHDAGSCVLASVCSFLPSARTPVDDFTFASVSRYRTQNGQRLRRNKYIYIYIYT